MNELTSIRVKLKQDRKLLQSSYKKQVDKSQYMSLIVDELVVLRQIVILLKLALSVLETM